MKRRAIVMVAALALAGGACGGDDDSAGGEFCDLASDLESNSVVDDVDINDPDAIENAFEEMIDLSEDAADSAPDEIKDDVELLVDETKRLVEELRDVDFDFTALDESVLDNPDVTAAGERLDEYLAQECGIGDDTGDLGDTVDSVDLEDIDDLGDIEDLGDIDEDAVRDQMVSAFTSLMGMTEEQANCVVDNIDLAEFENSENIDPSAYIELFDECGFDLTNPGG